jgi:hypothetical protein
MRSPGADQVLHGVVLFDAAFATVQLAVFSEFQFPRHSARLHQQTLRGLDLQSALALGNGPPASHLLRTPGPSSALPPAGARTNHSPAWLGRRTCIGRADQHAGRYGAGSQSRYLGLKDGQHLSIRFGCWPAYGRMNRSCDRGSIVMPQMAVVPPFAAWLPRRGSTRMPDLDCCGSLTRAGSCHRGQFCLCGQQARPGRRP